MYPTQVAVNVLTWIMHCSLQLPTKLWHDDKVNPETSVAAASEQIFTGVSPWSSRPDMLWASAAHANGPGPYQRHPGDLLTFGILHYVLDADSLAMHSSGILRIGPFHFPARCCKRQLKLCFVVLYLSKRVKVDYLCSSYAASRYCFWQHLVCMCICLSAQYLEIYWSEIDVQPCNLVGI